MCVRSAGVSDMLTQMSPGRSVIGADKDNDHMIRRSYVAQTAIEEHLLMPPRHGDADEGDNESPYDVHTGRPHGLVI